jgi:hypothetical protein
VRFNAIVERYQRRARLRSVQGCSGWGAARFAGSVISDIGSRLQALALHIDPSEFFEVRTLT